VLKVDPHVVGVVKAFQAVAEAAIRSDTGGVPRATPFTSDHASWLDGGHWAVGADGTDPKPDDFTRFAYDNPEGLATAAQRQQATALLKRQVEARLNRCLDGSVFHTLGAGGLQVAGKPVDADFVSERLMTLYEIELLFIARYPGDAGKQTRKIKAAGLSAMNDVAQKMIAVATNVFAGTAVGAKFKDVRDAALRGQNPEFNRRTQSDVHIYGFNLLLAQAMRADGDVMASVRREHEWVTLKRQPAQSALAWKSKLLEVASTRTPPMLVDSLGFKEKFLVASNVGADPYTVCKVQAASGGDPLELATDDLVRWLQTRIDELPHAPAGSSGHAVKNDDSRKSRKHERDDARHPRHGEQRDDTRGQRDARGRADGQREDSNGDSKRTRKEDRECWSCGKTGHLSTDCQQKGSGRRPQAPKYVKSAVVAAFQELLTETVNDGLGKKGGKGKKDEGKKVALVAAIAASLTKIGPKSLKAGKGGRGLFAGLTNNNVDSAESEPEEY
jgi:hypothetical protein